MHNGRKYAEGARSLVRCRQPLHLHQPVQEPALNGLFPRFNLSGHGYVLGLMPGDSPCTVPEEPVTLPGHSGGYYLGRGARRVLRASKRFQAPCAWTVQPGLLYQDRLDLLGLVPDADAVALSVSDHLPHGPLRGIDNAGNQPGCYLRGDAYGPGVLDVEHPA